MAYHSRSHPGQAGINPSGKNKQPKEKGVFDFSAYGHDPRLTSLEPYRGNTKFPRNYHDAVFEHEPRRTSSKPNPGSADRYVEVKLNAGEVEKVKVKDPRARARPDQKTKTLYHYTSEKGQVGILESGKIKKSTDTTNDAAFGVGAYLTSRKPYAGKLQLARNNYDGFSNTAIDAIDAGRVDRYVKVKVNADEVEKVQAPGRNIYRYPGSLHLADVSSITFGKVPDY